MGWSGRRCQFEGGKGGIIQYLGEEHLYNTNSQAQNASGLCLLCLKTSRETGEAEAVSKEKPRSEVRDVMSICGPF